MSFNCPNIEIDVFVICIQNVHIKCGLFHEIHFIFVYKKKNSILPWDWAVLLWDVDHDDGLYVESKGMNSGTVV